MIELVVTKEWYRQIKCGTSQTITMFDRIYTGCECYYKRPEYRGDYDYGVIRFRNEKLENDLNHHLNLPDVSIGTNVAPTENKRLTAIKSIGVSRMSKKHKKNKIIPHKPVSKSNCKKCGKETNIFVCGTLCPDCWNCVPPIDRATINTRIGGETNA